MQPRERERILAVRLARGATVEGRPSTLLRDRRERESTATRDCVEKDAAVTVHHAYNPLLERERRRGCSSAVNPQKTLVRLVINRTHKKIDSYHMFEISLQTRC